MSDPPTYEKGHEYDRFPGGAPMDCTYYWCHRCGMFKIEYAGDPSHYFVPGTAMQWEVLAWVFETTEVAAEPPCGGKNG